jgi:hypothetical protein
LRYKKMIGFVMRTHVLLQKGFTNESIYVKF